MVAVGFITWDIRHGLSPEGAATECRKKNVLVMFHKCEMHSAIAKCLRKDSEWYEVNRSGILKEIDEAETEKALEKILSNLWDGEQLNTVM